MSALFLASEFDCNIEVEALLTSSFEEYDCEIQFL